MKIGNKIPAKVTRTVVLEKDCPKGCPVPAPMKEGQEAPKSTCEECEGKGVTRLSLTLQALPLGYEEKVHSWIPFPKPPKKWVQVKGQVALDQNKVPISEELFDDPDYQRKNKRAVTLQGVAFVYEALRGDKSISFSTPVPPNPDDPGVMEAFFSSILQEVVEANFTAGDFTSLLNEVRQISLDKTKLYQEIREGF